MRIDPRLIAQTSDVAATQRKREAEASQSAGKASDPAVKVSLSEPAAVLKAFGAAVANGPATRVETVARFRDQIDRGTYQPTGEGIAKAIIARGGEQIDIDELRR